jgi:putative SOS response-associated peptidase YedK
MQNPVDVTVKLSGNMIREGKLPKMKKKRMKEEAPMLFAGLWETWDDEEGPVETCAILTTDANHLTKETHNRMPVVLAGDDALAWIEAGDDKEKLKELLRPFAPDKLTFHAVDTMDGNVRNNSPDCIKPT